MATLNPHPIKVLLSISSVTYTPIFFCKATPKCSKTKVRKNPHPKSCSQVMFPGNVCYPSSVSNHDSRRVDLLPLVQQINETLVYGIRKITTLTPKDDIINNESKQQLVKRHHFPRLCGPGCLQAQLLTQLLSKLRQPCYPKHSFVLPNVHIEPLGRNSQNFI